MSEKYEIDLEKGPAVGITGFESKYNTNKAKAQKVSVMLDHYLNFVSEFAGTFIMLWIGLGANATVFLSNKAAGDFLSINIAWAIGVMFGILVGNRSGAHLNPAVTIANAALRKFPLVKVPIYIAGQLLGAMLATLVIYGNNVAPIGIFDATNADHSIDTGSSSATIFATYPQTFMSANGRFFSEFSSSVILMFGIYLLDHTHNKKVHSIPMACGVAILILGIGISSGWETGCALNPARDFGPRLVTYMLGYGSQVFTGAKFYFWVPIIAPILGCLTGGVLYDLYSGIEESPMRRVLDWICGEHREAPMDKLMLHHANLSTGSVDAVVASPEWNASGSGTGGCGSSSSATISESADGPELRRRAVPMDEESNIASVTDLTEVESTPAVMLATSAAAGGSSTA